MIPGIPLLHSSPSRPHSSMPLLWKGFPEVSVQATHPSVCIHGTRCMPWIWNLPNCIWQGWAYWMQVCKFSFTYAKNSAEFLFYSWTTFCGSSRNIHKIEFLDRKVPSCNGAVRMMEWAFPKVLDSLVLVLPVTTSAPRISLPASATQQCCSSKQLPSLSLQPGPHRFSLTQLISGQWSIIYGLKLL